MSTFILKFFLLLTLMGLAACGKPQQHEPGSALRISCEGDPQTLDPRKVRDLPTITVMHMLYEGLMRQQADGLLAPAIAASVNLSPDEKTYTFTLRPTAWSNGQPVTAQDFEATWKSILDPQFPSPNAYQLYTICGAQAAKEGRIPLDQVGVKAVDEHTLVVELEQPTPYFLQLVATHFYYPVHASLRSSLGLHALNEEHMITNGPYQLEKWSRCNELITIPNPYYWDKDALKLKRISLLILDHTTAFQLFQRGELDWIGSPLSALPPDALKLLKDQGQLKGVLAAGLYLLRINTKCPPFDHVKMRRAFALALNRHELIEHVLQGNQIPALGIIPPCFLSRPSLFKDHAVAYARQLFEEALSEQNLRPQDLPSLSLHYPCGERAHKIAQVAQQQWKECLGVHVALQSTEPKAYYDQLQKHDYQLGIGSWFADFRDPIAFLEIFKLKENGTNHTQWESPAYIALLDRSAQQKLQTEREDILRDAEKVLMQEMPIVPLFYNSYHYVHNPAIQGIYFSELGYLDFKKAYWKSS